jgi:hypothetical protein
MLAEGVTGSSARFDYSKHILQQYSGQPANGQQEEEGRGVR